MGGHPRVHEHGPETSEIGHIGLRLGKIEESGRLTRPQSAVQEGDFSARAQSFTSLQVLVSPFEPLIKRLYSLELLFASSSWLEKQYQLIYDTLDIPHEVMVPVKTWLP